MITYILWKVFVFNGFDIELFNVCIATFYSISSIIFDVIAFPIEIIALIIYRIIKRKNKNE